MTRRRLAFIAFAVFDVLLLAVLAGLFLVRSERSEVERLADLGIVRLEQPVALEDFRLTDQHGEVFTRADMQGYWNFVFFGFTSCPDVCPLSMQALEAFYRGLAESGLQDQTRVIMVSVDPLRDSPEVMGTYVEGFHPDFVGLTGEYPQLAGLAEQLFIAFAMPQEHGGGHGQEDYLVQHSDYIAVIDPSGHYRGVVHAPHSRERLNQAYQALRGY